jgi:RimJ/RimL family protein N-acetyltransferase
MRSPSQWLQALKYRGYIGPKYDGLAGKFRLLKDIKVGHFEIISFAEPSWWEKPFAPDPAMSIGIFKSLDEAARYLPEMQEAYGRDFQGRWQTFFSREQWLLLSFHGKSLSSFVWVQDGNVGAASHYVQLQPNELRIFRGGVLPQFRRKGVSTMRHILLLQHLFSLGYTRIYTDAYEDNIYSVRAHRKAGYRHFGRCLVKPSFRKGRDFIKWV